MKIKTAKGTELECEAITSNPSPLRMYLHLINIDLEGAKTIFEDNTQLPIEGYPMFNTVQSISLEGTARVKVSLRNGGN